MSTIIKANSYCPVCRGVVLADCRHDHSDFQLQRARIADETMVDHRRLVRELDVALNGEAGAAKQASLCDIVAQVKDQRWKLVRAE